MTETSGHQPCGDGPGGTPAPASTDPSARLDEMAQAIAARDAFLAIAAHELRNPMTPILAQAQRLRRLADRTDDGGDIARGLQRLEALIEHDVRRATVLLDVSRITTGKFRLDAEPFDLAELAGATVEALAPAAHYVGSAIRLDAPDNLACRLDRPAVDQILDTLVTNAVKSGAGTPIVLRLAREDERARIEVSDQGIGISEQDQTRIFDRFERAVSQGSKAGGFGVGLWVVGQLVDAMSGRIAVASSPGAGTTFTVELPLEVADPAQA
ncbi:MAG: HAMP domain-containing sensor histidine kinase [Microvirga sp.]